ncbi:MAG: hypothetical protein V7731_03060 [Amphritea sp.]
MDEMTETTQPVAQQDSGSHAKIVYILYLVSLVVGVTALVGLVMAYIYRSDAPQWLKTHYQWQIRTFWIGLLYTVIGIISSFILIGYLILIFNLVWFIVRSVKGLSALEKKQPVSNPTGWLF